MTRHQVKAIALPKMREHNAVETVLIFMPTPHTPVATIGTVPFLMDQRGPSIPIFDDPRGTRLLFNDTSYAVNGYGPTDGTRQRAILGPWPPLQQIGDELQ
jgi:hypothetical protein